MTRLTRSDRFLTTVLEIAQAVLRRDDVVTLASGREVKAVSGFDQRILDRLYHKRLVQLEETISKTPFGRAITAHLAEWQTEIGFSTHISGNNGLTSAHNQFWLHPGATDAGLVGAYVQEARHIWQIRQLGVDVVLGLGPAMDKVLHLIMEADANAFEQKFLEDYVQQTGVSAPFDAFLRRNREAPREEMSDSERFLYWSELIRTRSAYIDQGYDRRDALNVRAEKGEVLADVENLTSWAIDIARKISGYWPFAEPADGAASYLAAVDDERLRWAAGLVQRTPPQGCWAPKANTPIPDALRLDK